MAEFTDQQTVIHALRQGRYNPIILDFDHTLFLGNSTERFLDSLRPRLLAFVLVVCSDWVVQILTWLGRCRYDDQRDFARVLVCSRLMPWGRVHWRKHAHAEAVGLANKVLLDNIPTDRPVVVVSYGFHPIIAPLLEGMGLGNATLIASRPESPRLNLRTAGKRRTLETYVPQEEWGGALFITDSEDDQELIDAIPHSHLIQWKSDASPAFQGLYVPMRYTVQGKYPNSRYFTYQILFEDFALLLLAYAFAWDYALALGYLFASLYCIYEIGYYDNDHRAIAYETDPVVSNASRMFPSHPRIKPWLFALGFALIGICFAHPPAWGDPFAIIVHLTVHLGVWTWVLLLVYGVFWVFNRLEPERRILVFPILHVLKTCSYVLFVPLTTLGAMLVAAQVLSISANYTVYRLGKDVDRVNRHAWRMIAFIVFTGAYLVMTGANLASLGYTRLMVILLWCLIRSVERSKRKSILRMAVETLKSNG